MGLAMGNGVSAVTGGGGVVGKELWESVEFWDSLFCGQCFCPLWIFEFSYRHDMFSCTLGLGSKTSIVDILPTAQQKNDGYGI